MFTFYLLFLPVVTLASLPISFNQSDLEIDLAQPDSAMFLLEVSDYSHLGTTI